uniref:homeobox protein 2-like isoform X1 n=1 Tax=Styela clava TaxID=7725 RepID=UPI00193AC0B6|nr:homeobox protein 2-like isoform X1 [Styela clava]XP_039260977.1 homeobox protein 2-like isoform X1 [Styela clava]XP_039260978.1 homeobox protein 2-like isoform X1 [Styela clava]
MQMENSQRRENAVPQRTLEFRQAMKDFRTMFPTLDSGLIECVLRSNAGHVDSTIDQLLQLSQDPNAKTRNRGGWNANEDSTDTDDSIPSELLDPPTSSDDDIPVRDPPPMYTPRVGDPPPNFFGPNQPVEVPVSEKKRGSHKHSKSNGYHTKTSKKCYRAWNPPMLGALPDDFLRILPQQFLDPSSSKEKSKKISSGSKKRTPPTSSNSGHRSVDPVFSHRSTHSGDRELSTRHEKYTPPILNNPASTTPLSHHSPSINNESTDEDLTPPPRPPRTIQPRRLPQYNERDRNLPLHSDSIVPGNLSIRLASESRGFQHQSMDPTLSNGQRQRHHHRSSRSNHSRSHNNLPLQQNLPSYNQTTNLNGSNHITRRSSDFTSRRMVMVSRTSEPAISVSHNNGNHNGFQSPINNDRPSSHRSYHRSSSNSFSSNHHHHQTSSGHHSPVFQRGGSPAFISSQSRSGRPSSASSSRSRPRTAHEQEQYVEDQKLAILLQNEEFIRELKRNDEFLKALEKDRPNNISSIPTTPIAEIADRDIVPLPDPDAKYTHGSQNPSVLKRVGMDDPEKEDEKMFKENLKHMGKSARKKFNEIAKKFSVKRKTSYKSMKNIDPVFANCDDNFDEVPGPVPRSPVFDL